MMITSKIEDYLDANSHREHMRRNTFYGYSRGEIDGDYVLAMYNQLLMMAADDECADLLASMSLDEWHSVQNWMYL